jgi:hypothetical protein
LCVDPTAVGTATRESKRVRTFAVNNSKFQFAIKWRSIDWLPIHAGIFVSKRNEVFDLDHLLL